MNINAQLLVWLKGADLYAGTAFLTLVGKMGYSDRLSGIKRLDYYRFDINSGAAGGSGNNAPDETVAVLKTVLDRQSTFYNRNKHAYSLDCSWDGVNRLEGLARDEVRSQWIREISNLLKNKPVRDFDGNDPPDRVNLNSFNGFIAEVLVEEEDPSARESVAAKLQGGLGGTIVSCMNRATLWWLALCVPTRDEAAALAREIAVTTRRDSGLLSNPNFQNAEIVTVEKTRQA